MMSMRLTRIGSKNRPAYRIVVVDSERPRESRAKEYLGTYNPTVEPAAYKIDVAKAQAWIAKGAKPSQTVQSLLTKALKKAKKS
jgi:small subunit ribosomal protein S16